MSVESHVLAQGATGNVTFWHRNRFQFVADQLAVEPAVTVLDYGAGAGGLARYVSAHAGSRYYFFDESQAVMRFLRDELGPAHDGTALVGSGQAQLTVALDVIEHIDDDLAAVRTLSNSTQPGGRIIITVPALPALWSSWDKNLGHFRRYTRSSLGALSAATGLEPIEISYLFPEMLPAGVYRRVSDRRGSQKQDAAHFPHFSQPADRVLYAVSRATTRLRRLMPAGTSLVAVLRKPLDNLMHVAE